MTHFPAIECCDIDVYQVEIIIPPAGTFPAFRGSSNIFPFPASVGIANKVGPSVQTVLEPLQFSVQRQHLNRWT
jgi:hypothetical protein